MLHTFWLMATPSSISNTTVSTAIVAIFCTLRSSDAGTYITARGGKWRELRWSISQVGLGGEAAEVEVWREVEGRALEGHYTWGRRWRTVVDEKETRVYTTA